MAQAVRRVAGALPVQFGPEAPDPGHDADRSLRRAPDRAAGLSDDLGAAVDLGRHHSMKKVIKVAIGIPNEGMTLPEPYGNRLLMMFHLGALQLASRNGIKEYEGVPFDYPEGVEYQFFYSRVGRVLTPLAR